VSPVSSYDPAALLAQYRPVVQYDSLESFYTDWAAVITDHPGNALKRADGTVIAVAAAAPDAGSVPLLNLAFLRPDVYPNGEPVLATDFVGETAGDYVTAARVMHAMPGYANKVHGRVVTEQGVTWLQYWFFMYYDNPGFLDLGRHEGDMEMIQIRLDASGQPDVANYAQHRSGLKAPWDEIETQDGAPVVFSARGTHASMMRSGTLVSDRSFIPDHNDARGPRVQLDLISLSPADTPWAFWPGHWGGTKPNDEVLGKLGVEANSPAAMTAHAAWQDPNAFYNSCAQADLPPIGEQHTSGLPIPSAPELEVRPAPEGGAVQVDYTIPSSPDAPPPDRLVVAVDSSGGQLPPATTVVPDPGPSGQLQTRVAPGARTVTVLGTTHSAEGAVSRTAQATTSMP
jgi:hypothetical protein